MGRALVNYIKVKTVEDPLEKVGWSLGDTLYANSSINPKRL